jgi:AcrR family transcriptional regulator
VYRHFPRRQDLIDALFVEVVREMRAAVVEVVQLNAPAHEVLCALGPKFIEIGDRYRLLDVHPELRARAPHARRARRATDPGPGWGSAEPAACRPAGSVRSRGSSPCPSYAPAEKRSWGGFHRRRS